MRREDTDPIRRTLLATLATAGLLGAARVPAAAAPADRSIRVLHIMSYHRSWQWNRDQYDAFQAALVGLDVAYEVLEMDMKRHSEPEWRDAIQARAIRLIESWQPDLIYSNDDYAQEIVVQQLPEGDTPLLFSAVNADPARYGYDRRRDVTGVLEHEHYVQTIHLLREMAPGVRRIAVLMDEDPTWTGVMARMRAALSELPDVEVASWDLLPTYDGYRRRVAQCQSQVDALAVLGVFNLKDAAGLDVPFETVLRWTAENSRLPDFSFWTSRVELGTLASVSVSGREQGQLAGEMARQILVEGLSPAEIPMRPTLRGEPVISLARARLLGIEVPSSTLLKSQVLTRFAWDG